MFDIINNKIRLTRGDYGKIECVLRDGAGDPYEMQDGDVLTLTVRDVASADSPVMLQVSSVTNMLAIQHEDTAGLPVGTYSADIQLTTADGKRLTFWPKLDEIKYAREKNLRNFELFPEVTRV